MRFIWVLWAVPVLETGWSQSPPWFVEPQEFHSSISLWYQWNTCRWRFLMKLETQWKSFLSSGRNHSAADKDTLAYTAWPDGLKFITNSVLFLFSKWFITKFCFPISIFQHHFSGSGLFQGLSGDFRFSFFAFSERFLTPYLGDLAHRDLWRGSEWLKR